MGRTQVDEVFEQCLAAMQTQGLTVEDCLQRYPALREELEPLLSLAARLQTARSLRPAAEFKAAAARRLSKRAAARPAPPRRKTGLLELWTGARAQPRMRLSPLLAGVLLVVLIASGFGAAAASAQSLPGDLLYPVKRAEEALHYALTLDEAGRAELRLDYAGRRIDEAVALVRENRTQALDQVLADYNDQIQSGLAFLEPGSPLTAAQQQALAGRLLDETQQHLRDGLDFVNQAAPPAAQATIETALSTSQQAYDQAAKILQDSDSGGSLQPTPSAPPALTAAPTLSLTPPGSPSQGPSLSTPVAAPSPTALPPLPTRPDSGPVPTGNVVRTPETSDSAARTATLPPKPTATPPLASNLPSPTGAKATDRPTFSPTPQSNPTAWPSPSTGNLATPVATRTPGNSVVSPTEIIVTPPNAPPVDNDLQPAPTSTPARPVTRKP